MSGQDYSSSHFVKVFHFAFFLSPGIGIGIVEAVEVKYQLCKSTKRLSKVSLWRHNKWCMSCNWGLSLWWLLFILLRMVPMVWTVKNAVTAVMPMDVTTQLVTATVWLDGQVRPYNTVLATDLSIHSLNTYHNITVYRKYHSFPLPPAICGSSVVHSVPVSAMWMSDKATIFIMQLDIVNS